MALIPYEDPFAFASRVLPSQGHTLSTKTLEIPEEDRNLFEQLRSDPKMTNIRDEIALNKYLRILLQREFDTQSLEGRAKLAQRVLDAVRDAYGPNPAYEEKLLQNLEAVLPAAKMSVTLARAMSKLLETSGKLAEQQQKILEGTVITVRGDSRERMQEILSRIIRPCCPPEVWYAIQERAASFAPSAGAIEETDLR